MTHRVLMTQRVSINVRLDGEFKVTRRQLAVHVITKHCGKVGLYLTDNVKLAGRVIVIWTGQNVLEETQHSL